MPSQKRTILETLDRKTLIELSKAVGFTGMQALTKAELITTLTRKRSVGLEDLLGQLGMGTLKHICAKLGLNLGGVSKQDQIDKILVKGKPESKAWKKKAPNQAQKTIEPGPRPIPRKPKWTPPMPASNGNELETRLWAAADHLWANTGLRPSEFSTPVLGLIFLRYAESKFSQRIPG